MKNHLLKSHVTIMDYSKLKNVYPNSVYTAIEKGKIKVDYVGLSMIKMIDFSKCGGYDFSVKNQDKSKLQKWFDRKGKSLSKNKKP